MPSSDWRSPAAYADTNGLSAAGFAWEYLRRDEDYRGDFRRIRTLPRTDIDARAAFAERWGLRFPSRSGPACRARRHFLGVRTAA